MVGLAVGVAGFATLHVGRGIAAGLARPRLWSLLFLVEGVFEVGVAVALLVADDRDAGTFALAAGGSARLAGVVVVGSVVPGLIGRRVVAANGLVDSAGTAAPSLLIGMPSLLVSSVLMALLINAGPVAVALLAAPAEEWAGHRRGWWWPGFRCSWCRSSRR